MTPEQYCQYKAGSSGSSFYYSFLFLPHDKRLAITALYAFCREVDDVVDDCNDPDTARATLAWWHSEIDRLFQGRPQHPVGQALLPAIQRFPLEQQHFHEIINGMEMDLSQSRYETFDALRLYCYRVASVVGLLSAAIFGYNNARTLEYAKHLGLAFQLINIIRDVGEDARRGRIYLPADDLARFGIVASDLLKDEAPDNFSVLMAFQAERAMHHYNQAMANLPDEDRANQLTGLIMAAIYLTLLDEIRKDGYHVLQHKVGLTPLRKLWVAWRTLRSEKRRRKTGRRP